MAQERKAHHSDSASFAVRAAAGMNTPALALLSNINGKFLEIIASAQKEWVDFVYRRIKEDIGISQQLMTCQSLADIHEVYSQYLRKAFSQY